MTRRQEIEKVQGRIRRVLSRIEQAKPVLGDPPPEIVRFVSELDQLLADMESESQKIDDLIFLYAAQVCGEKGQVLTVDVSEVPEELREEVLQAVIRMHA